MLTQEIKISVLSIDKGDDTIQFQIDITNGVCSQLLSSTVMLTILKNLQPNYFHFSRQLMKE